MALNISKVEKVKSENRVEQPLLEVGAYPARLVQVIDLGIQKQMPYQGKEKPPKPQIGLTYELLDEFMVDEDGKELEDKPRWVSEMINVSHIDADLAKSTKRYMVLDPKVDDGGDFTKQLGKPVMVTLVHNQGKSKKGGEVVTYVNVGNISAMRDKDAAKASDLINKSSFFDLDEPDLEVFNSLPDFIKGIIQSNLEYNGSKLQELLGEEPETKEGEKDEEW